MATSREQRLEQPVHAVGQVLAVVENEQQLLIREEVPDRGWRRFLVIAETEGCGQRRRVHVRA
jgi:hypothetical protein